MSYTSLTYHIVFGTYSRYSTIPIAHESELYAFIYRFLTKREAKVWRIGGMPDHVHILCDIPAKYSVAEFVKTLKAEASKFLRTNQHFPNWYGWAEGYGAFTVEKSQMETRRQYIMNQKAHHGRLSFEDELSMLLQQYGISRP
ncbi:MAG: IS200/IS605 family transposase [Bacteroidales bacterium]|nr:IS200/IS605 family transposase [Bacteroidales bacterium]